MFGFPRSFYLAMLAAAATTVAILLYLAILALPADPGRDTGTGIPCHTHLGKATKVVDGDTFDALINIGYDAFVAVRLRLLRINTPERKQPGWQEATDATRRAVEGKTLLITACRKDAFGRWLAEVEIDGIGNLSDWLLNEGLAKPYKEKK